MSQAFGESGRKDLNNDRLESGRTMRDAHCLRDHHWFLIYRRFKERVDELKGTLFKDLQEAGINRTRRGCESVDGAQNYYSLTTLALLTCSQLNWQVVGTS